MYITPDSTTERGEFYTIAPTVPSGVEPDENIRFTLTFKPKSSGYRSATVTIMSDDPARQEYSFTVIGEGKTALVPDIKVIQNSVDIPAEIGMYDFGSVWTEDINPPSVQFSIENTGATALIVSSIGFETLPSGQFFISLTVPITVDPGTSVPFTVQFDPSTPGDLSDEVEIINDDPDENPYIFTVRGYGATSPVPDINVQEIANGSTFDLGPVPLSSWASQSFTIENTGTEDLQIYSIISKYPPYFTVDTSRTDITVSPAKSTTFSVIFSPTDTKLRKSFIEIDSNDNDVRPYRFTITGYGSKGSEPDIYVMQAVTCYPDGSNYKKYIDCGT